MYIFSGRFKEGCKDEDNLLSHTLYAPIYKFDEIDINIGIDINIDMNILYPIRLPYI